MIFNFLMRKGYWIKGSDIKVLLIVERFVKYDFKGRVISREMWWDDLKVIEFE